MPRGKTLTVTLEHLCSSRAVLSPLRRLSSAVLLAVIVVANHAEGLQESNELSNRP